MLGTVDIFVCQNFNKELIFAVWWDILKEPRAEITALWAMKEKVGFLFIGSYTKWTVMHSMSVTFTCSKFWCDDIFIDTLQVETVTVPHSW